MGEYDGTDWSIPLSATTDKKKEKRGATQADLAVHCGYNRSEFSRKMHGTSKMSSEVVQQIIKALTEWEAITTKGQARELLTLMDAPDFSPADWDAFPLKLLETESDEQPRKAIVAHPITNDLLREEKKEAGCDRIASDTTLYPSGGGETLTSVSRDSTNVTAPSHIERQPISWRVLSFEAIRDRWVVYLVLPLLFC